jgi:hypothetical protein
MEMRGVMPECLLLIAMAMGAFSCAIDSLDKAMILDKQICLTL